MTEPASGPSFSIFETTADVGVEARGSDLPQVFESAGLGLSHLTVGLETLPESKKMSLKLVSDDLESLFVSWLNELIYLRDTTGFVGKRFSVKIPNEWELQAEIWGGVLDPKTQEMKMEAKAATRHGLKIGGSGGDYRARVIFDI